MKIVADYVRILRPLNILISAVTVLACADILNALENIPLLIYTILTVGLFIGGANIFNDIQDKKEDKINKPDRPIAAEIISLKAAGNYAKLLVISGAGMCFLLPLSRVISSILSIDSKLHCLLFLRNVFSSFIILDPFVCKKILYV